jgi:hypothetical protein
LINIKRFSAQFAKFTLSIRSCRINVCGLVNNGFLKLTLGLRIRNTCSITIVHAQRTPDEALN